jgi:gamma-glutamyltranspeptidase/glutathione hydrolase
MVAAIAGGHPQTVAAALDALDRGGNAYDAAVAGGFAAAVTEPGLTSLGGGGFLLARTAEGTERFFDFFVDTPGRGRPEGSLVPDLDPVVIRFRGAEQTFYVGPGSVAVPGCLAGYVHVHACLGRLPLEEVLTPARRLADDGVLLNAQQAHIFELLEPIFLLTAEGREIYSRDGKLLGEGDSFYVADYGRFLDLVASGEVQGLGSPRVRDVLADLMSESDGLVTTTDLDRYAVHERAPLAFTYRGARIITNPPPSFGGAIVALGLQELERRPKPDWGSAAQLSALGDTFEHMLGEHRRRAAGPQSSKGTTHLSVADVEGNLAAMTTSNGSNSGILVPGTGVHLNNIMGEEDLHPGGFHSEPPGQRVGSMMAPTIVVRPDGEAIALGSGGSERIRSALTQVITNLLDHDMGLQEAVDRPRAHWDGAALQVEPGFDPHVLEQVNDQRPVNEWSEHNLYFGGTHAVSTGGEAAGDSRRGGSTAVV